MKSTLSSITNF